MTLQNEYLWTFATPRVRWFLYRKSRSGQVSEEVLGEEFGGTVTCDFYAGYNRLGGLQRCWVHLIRDLAELAEVNADRPGVVAWVETIKVLYQEAKQFSHPQERVGRRQRRHFERRLAAPQRVLAQRIIRHLGELFLFLGDPRVPADNNLAERSLRPAVLARKISGGARSAKGSRTRRALVSLFGTWQVQGKPLLASCRQLLLPTQTT